MVLVDGCKQMTMTPQLLLNIYKILKQTISKKDTSGKIKTFNLPLIAYHKIISEFPNYSRM